MTELPETSPSEPVIKFGPVRESLYDVCVAVTNRVDREARPRLRLLHPGLPAVVTTTARVSGATLSGIERLWWNTEGGDRIRLELVTAIPPLARTLLDSAFTMMLLFDEPSDNVRWYHASGWRDLERSQRRFEQRYGTDPKWRDWLDEGARYVEDYKVDVTEEQAKAPHLIEWWPNPGKMTRSRKDGTPYVRNAETRAFLLHLNDWYYGALSGDSHLSYLGMLRRGGALVERPGRVAGLVKYGSTAFLNSVTLYMVLLSEIAIGAELPFESATLAKLWKYFSAWQPARELWEARYIGVLHDDAG